MSNYPVCRRYDSIHGKTDSNKRLLELISKFSKVAGYENNTQNQVVFPYTNNELTEKEIRKVIHQSLKFKKPKNKSK